MKNRPRVGILKCLVCLSLILFFAISCKPQNTRYQYNEQIVHLQILDVPECLLNAITQFQVDITAESGAYAPQRLSLSVSPNDKTHLTLFFPTTATGVFTITAAGQDSGKRTLIVDSQQIDLDGAPDLQLNLHAKSQIPFNDGWFLMDRASLDASVTYNGIWANSTDDVWAVGNKGKFSHWNGADWQMNEVTTNEVFYGIWGADAQNVWAVGSYGTILRWNGVDWRPIASNTRNQLSSICGFNSNAIWTVGQDGYIAYFNGNHWGENIDLKGAISSYYLTSISCLSDNTAWAVGHSGLRIYYNGTTWEKVTPDALVNDLVSIWTDAQRQIWILERNNIENRIYFSDDRGKRWSQRFSIPQTVTLTSLQGGLFDGRMLSVGALDLPAPSAQAGYILQLPPTGQSTKEIPIAESPPLVSLAVLGHDVWMAGAQGSILHFCADATGTP